ncbi:MAG: hypothetical protein AAF389_05000 [Gemmatimonadota bacterium]
MLQRSSTLAAALVLATVAGGPVSGQQRPDTGVALSSHPERIAASVLMSSLLSAGGLYVGAIAAYGQSNETAAVGTFMLSTTLGAAVGASGMSEGWEGPIVGSVIGMLVGFGVAKATSDGLGSGASLFTYSLTHGLVTTLIANGWSR